MLSSLLLASSLLLTAALADVSCDAQPIVDACVSGYKPRIAACQANGNDWICLCDVYIDVLTCYNNCPKSNERSPVANETTSYCAAAEPLRAAASSSMASVASVAKTATTATPSAAATSFSTLSGAASGEHSATAASASVSAPAFETGAASSRRLTTPAGAAAFALLAAAGLF